MAEIFLPEAFLRARLNNLLTTIYEAPEFGMPQSLFMESDVYRRTHQCCLEPTRLLILQRLAKTTKTFVSKADKMFSEEKKENKIRYF